MRALVGSRAARTRISDRYQGGNKQYHCHRHQALLPARDAAGQGSVNPCRV
jgi:hypothetical protein